MKRVLIISYYWPPSGGAGVQRWLKFVKYLRCFGWDPILYVPHNPEYPETDPSLIKDIPDGIEIMRKSIWEPYDAYKKLIGRKKEERINASFLSEKKKNKVLENLSVWIRGNLFIPDARKFWIRPSVTYLSRYLENNTPDVIVSTGPPHSMHLIAMPLARRFSIPWLADFRDPWTNIDFYKDLKLTSWADKKHHQLEKTVLKSADAVTVISETMASDLQEIQPRNYDVITNGYDPDDIPEQDDPSILPDEKFSIAHIGTMVSSRNPVPLWEALKILVNENEGFAHDLEIKLVGKVDFTVMDSIDSYGLTQYLKRIEYMPHDEVVKCQLQSRVLLLIINQTPNAKMILTGKFFEYLAARRPVLCLGPADGDAAKIMKQTGAGLISDFADTIGMQKNLLDLYSSYKSGKVSVGSHHIEQYTRKELTRRLTEVFDRIMDGRINP